MIATLRRRSDIRALFWPALTALLAFVVLVFLGSWQLHRLAWKTDLLARVQSRAQGEAVSLSEATAIWNRDPREVEYQRIRLTGRFLHDGELYLYATLQGSYGWTVITPLMEGAYLVPVMRGVVPEARKDPASRPQGQIAGDVDLVGRARLSEKPSFFTPAADPGRRTYFARDLDVMRPLWEAVKLKAAPKTAWTPFFLELDGPAPPGGLPALSAGPIVLRNDHLGYAVTWYGLAVVLLAVFAAYAWGQIRAGEPAEPVPPPA